MSNNPVSINDQDAARTARNRQNASHSTGPKTEAGKKRSSLNGLRHGLTGHTILLPTEDLAAYQDFTENFPHVHYGFDKHGPPYLDVGQASTSWQPHHGEHLNNPHYGRKRTSPDELLRRIETRREKNEHARTTPPRQNS